MTTEAERREFVARYDQLPRGSAERAAMRLEAGVSHSAVANWRHRLGMARTACGCGADLVGREESCATCRREAARYAHVARTYGLTAAAFDQLHEDQGGRCAACGDEPPSEGTYAQRSLHVDHDHETGRVRGLLCHPCNLALGYAQEDPARLLGLAAYIVVAKQEAPQVTDAD